VCPTANFLKALEELPPGPPGAPARTNPEAATRTRDPSQQWLVLEPNRIEKQCWKDLWRYRELFAILAWRDITVRYKQTFIGVAWALIRPFLT